MLQMNQKQKEEIFGKLEAIDKVMTDKKHLLIIVHNNPDPDAIASAAGLGYFLEKRYGMKSSIAYGGNIGRAENQAMITKLKIKLKQINRIRFEKYDRIALVDSQPGAGNNSLPESVDCDLVVDHHPQREHKSRALMFIKPDIGVSATIIIQWLVAAEMEIPSDLATALAYAISSETQNLGREATAVDIDAYLTVFVKANLRKLAQITHPKLPRSYFVTLARALNQAKSFRNLICAHLGDVPAAEMVSEMADFFLRHERIGWTLCTGRFKGLMIISVRTRNPHAKAGRLVKHMVPDPDTVGGHDMIAGGYIKLDSGKKDELKDWQNRLASKFAQLRGYDNVEWKAVVDWEKLF